MSDDIHPALTAEDWAYIAKYEIRYISAEAGPVSWSSFDREPDAAKLVAIANAALPDDSPYKITRADIDAINSAAGWAYGEGSDMTAEAAWIAAKKLAALLPPE